MRFLNQTFITILLSICLTGCQPYVHIVSLPGIDNELVMRVILTYASTLQHDKKLFLEDSSASYGGQGNYIRKIRLTFSSQSILELREARQLLVDVVDGFLDQVNFDPELGPLTSSYPISSDDLEICIKFESYHGLYVDKRYVHSAKLEEKWAFFYAFDITNEFGIWDRDCECWHQRVEPFYKSRQIVTIEREAEKLYKANHPEPKSLFSGDRYLDNNKTDHTTPPY